MDFHQLWTTLSAPDNVPIVLLALAVPFYTWYGLRQAFANDRLIAQLEADPALAKTHHRKTQPWRPEWDREVYVWPYLLRIEFLAAIILTVLLLVWSILLNAPLEEPANPTLTMNPSKAPWYFVGLQELLVYFDPWLAGVVIPLLIIGGLMAIPYIDTNPLGSGYYTFKQRKGAILTFLFGFFALWLTIAIVFIGVFVRGPGWIWFWPGTTWDPNRVVFRSESRPAFRRALPGDLHRACRVPRPQTHHAEQVQSQALRPHEPSAISGDAVLPRPDAGGPRKNSSPPDLPHQIYMGDPWFNIYEGAAECCSRVPLPTRAK